MHGGNTRGGAATGSNTKSSAGWCDGGPGQQDCEHRKADGAITVLQHWKLRQSLTSRAPYTRGRRTRAQAMQQQHNIDKIHVVKVVREVADDASVDAVASGVHASGVSAVPAPA